MDTIENAILTRRSVRKYINKSIDKELVTLIQEKIDEYNNEYNLDIQLITDNPDAFNSILASYGRFKNVHNYFALIGKKDDPNLHEKLGYVGEHLVLFAQTLGLNTCWVVGSYKKRKVVADIKDDEILVCVIALGYGETNGEKSKYKPIEKLYQAKQSIPPWFLEGVKAARLAPTAMNQQKFVIIYENNEIRIKSTGGMFPRLNLGIVRCHFEIGANRKLNTVLEYEEDK